VRAFKQRPAWVQQTKLAVIDEDRRLAPVAVPGSRPSGGFVLRSRLFMTRSPDWHTALQISGPTPILTLTSTLIVALHSELSEAQNTRLLALLPVRPAAGLLA